MDVENSASVTAAQEDPNITNNTATAPIMVKGIDVAVEHNVSETTAPTTSQVTYTTTVRNNSTTFEATGVEVSIALPGDVTYISDNSVGGTYDTGTGIWSIGTLPVSGSPGSTQTFEIIARVNDNAALGVDIVSTATATLIEADGDPSNNMREAKFTAEASADLSVNIPTANYDVNPGETVNITVEVTNNGPQTATGAQVGIGASAVTVANLPPGDTFTVQIPFDVAVTAPPGPVSVSVDVVPGAEIDLDNSNNSATTTVNVQPSADLNVSKGVDQPDRNPGDPVVYTITLTNTSTDQTATGITLTDVFPAAINYISDDGGGSYDPGTRQWTVNIPSLAATGSVTITVMAEVDPGASPGTYTNTVEITAADIYDPPVPGENTDSADVTVP
jgi:uncharacterized repeat protein (TIGR01451 family)